MRPTPGRPVNEGLNMNTRIWIVVSLAAGLSATAKAQGSDVEISEREMSSAAAANRDGLFLPTTLAARVGAAPALVSAFGGYDSARGAPAASAAAEVRLWGPIGLRAGAEYSAARSGARPTVGGRVQLLDQSRHGVDGSLSVFYRPEGFTEPEGEIETFVSLGRRIDSFTLLGNLVYGQDPEGNERDGEIRGAALYARDRWTIGVDARLRFAIGTQRAPSAAAEPRFDLLAGPVATVAVGPFALFGEAGPSVLRTAGARSVGVLGIAGVGALF
jgi:hypothetical protein